MRTWTTNIKNQIYAHRGYHDKPQIPENSIPAFKRAIERGWGCELDVHLLSDGTLAVFHDAKLERCTGAAGVIEDLSLATLKELRLEGTENQVPTFDEVLDLFEDSGLPLIIELKCERNNHKELTKAVCERLDSYKGEFVIESFDPRVVYQVKKLRPEIIRGQLAQNFLSAKTELKGYQKILFTSLILNIFTKPDFIAYKFADRKEKHVRNAVDKKGIQEVSWTIRSKKDFDKAVKAGCIPIFEKFDPEE